MNPGSCPACGAALASDDRFCEACGTDVNPPQSATSGDRPAESGCASCGGASFADGYCESCGRLRPDGRDHTELEAGGAAAVSDRGLRHSRNEDAFALTSLEGGDGLPVVATVICDGVSSTHGAADASLAAVRAARTVLATELRAGTDPEDATRQAVAAAARAVAKLARSGPESPSCTYVSAIVGPKTVTIGWLGDCRVYWLGAEPAQLTEDDSWATQMIVSGLMTEEQAYADRRAHVIVRWLGADAEDVEPRVITFDPPGPGSVLVCSDGLWNYIPQASAIAEVVPTAAQEPVAAARTLLDLALTAGGHDNITVAVIPYPLPTELCPPGSPPAAPVPPTA